MVFSRELCETSIERQKSELAQDRICKSIYLPSQSIEKHLCLKFLQIDPKLSSPLGNHFHFVHSSRRNGFASRALAPYIFWQGAIFSDTPLLKENAELFLIYPLGWNRYSEWPINSGVKQSVSR